MAPIPRNRPVFLLLGELALQGDIIAADSTTMIYLHVMKRPGAGAPSPLDDL